MNIVLIGPFFPYRGGISDTNQELCESLIKTGHKVDVITFKLQYPRFLFPGKTQFHKNNLKQNVKSIRIINSINPFNWINTSKVINGFLTNCISEPRNVYPLTPRKPWTKVKVYLGLALQIQG